MFGFLNKFKIPTLLGLGVILLGIGGGVFLVLQGQPFLTKAAPDQAPQNIQVSNLEDNATTISWQSNSPVAAFVTFGVGAVDEQTALDDRDGTAPKLHTTHYVTLKKLTPQTTYTYRIVSGKSYSETNKFTTASTDSNQNGFQPVIGSVFKDNQPLDEGIVYLSIPGAFLEAATVKNFGNFIIPINTVRKKDLSAIFDPDPETIAKITVVSNFGQASVLFKLNHLDQPIGPLKIGQDLDLTTPPASSEASPSATPKAPSGNKFDLNGDGVVNSSDYAIVIKNFGKNPKDKRADLNGDGVVDQKDVALILDQINRTNP